MKSAWILQIVTWCYIYFVCNCHLNSMSQETGKHTEKSGTCMLVVQRFMEIAMMMLMVHI